MRIIAGSHRHRIITPPTNFRARPTTDFAKENLFNVLNNHFDFEDLSVADLFSGTGAISYEFASRGAANILSVELNPTHHRFIQKTAKELGFNNIQAVCTNTLTFLKTAKGRAFDIVFADPPYDLEELPIIPDLVMKANILKSDGWLVLEHGSSTNFEKHSHFLRMRKYGSVHFSIFATTSNAETAEPRPENEEPAVG